MPKWLITGVFGAILYVKRLMGMLVQSLHIESLLTLIYIYTNTHNKVHLLKVLEKMNFAGV